MIYGLVQGFLIALVVTVSLWQLATKLMPARLHALHAKAAQFLSQGRMPNVVQKAGNALRPKSLQAKGCGSGCEACRLCATSESQKTRPMH